MTSCSTFNSLLLLILQHLWWLYCCIIAKHSYILSVYTYERTQIETHFKMYSFILISVWFTHEYAHKWGSSVPERSYMKEGRAEHRDEKGQSSLDPWKVLGEAGSSGLSFKMAVLLCTGLLYSTLRENTPNNHRLLLSISPSLSQGGHPITSPSSSAAELCQWDRQGETRKGQKVKFLLQISKHGHIWDGGWHTYVVLETRALGTDALKLSSHQERVCYTV